MQRSLVMSPYPSRRVYTPVHNRLRASSSSQDLSMSTANRSFSLSREAPRTVMVSRSPQARPMVSLSPQPRPLNYMASSLSPAPLVSRTTRVLSQQEYDVLKSEQQINQILVTNSQLNLRLCQAKAKEVQAEEQLQKEKEKMGASEQARQNEKEDLQLSENQQSVEDRRLASLIEECAQARLGIEQQNVQIRQVYEWQESQNKEMKALEVEITQLLEQNKTVMAGYQEKEGVQQARLKQQSIELAVLRELEDNAKQLIEENERLTEIIQLNSTSTAVLDLQNKIMLAEHAIRELTETHQDHAQQLEAYESIQNNINILLNENQRLNKIIQNNRLK